MSVLAYWGARTGIFLAVLGVLWAVGWRDVIAFFAAFIVAWLVSYLALPGLRVRAAEQMDGWISRSEKGIREAAAEEDAEIGADAEPTDHEAGTAR
ncbi:DUF4229 domain-containing protein [Demequina sp. SYSU T00192]|uniref:DUF4229 domain-containing protein n=1 Tax=Demequina litoralis TaxID=3051660 RepID=A0ABT8G870_9MICO|nr:DUF4229 domain-containing protein [Demequina sp. SYSU T00192]MDN4475350.1 DUF4229 domain-containing protein [Demequina sp. SYSU T00192]